MWFDNSGLIILGNANKISEIALHVQKTVWGIWKSWKEIRVWYFSSSVIQMCQVYFRMSDSSKNTNIDVFNLNAVEITRRTRTHMCDVFKLVIFCGAIMSVSKKYLLYAAHTHTHMHKLFHTSLSRSLISIFPINYHVVYLLLCCVYAMMMVAPAYLTSRRRVYTTTNIATTHFRHERYTCLLLSYIIIIAIAIYIHLCWQMIEEFSDIKAFKLMFKYIRFSTNIIVFIPYVKVALRVQYFSGARQRTKFKSNVTIPVAHSKHMFDV